MKKRYFKIIAALALVAILALSLFSCGTSAPSSLSNQLYKGAIDANGTTNSFTWDYDSSTYTLTIKGSGDMPNATNAAGVAWASVRNYVTTVNFVNENNVPITSIGDYAFYGMSNLKSINLPDGITKIGKLAFAYCLSLKGVTMNKNLAKIGTSAFEGCILLESVSLPTNVTAIGERAFAFCKALKDVIIAGNVTTLNNWTFKDCAALKSLKMRDTFKTGTIIGNPFEGAGVNKDTIKYVALAESGKIAVTVKYVDTNGNSVKDTEVKEYAFGEVYTLNAPEIDGYSRNEMTKTGVAADNNIEVTFTYTSTAAPSETTPPEAAPDSTEPTKDEGITTGTIVGVVIFVVVLVGLGIVIFVLMRPAKDNKDKNNRKK